MAGAQPPTNGGRTDFLQDEDYFMAVAFLAAQRSEDPSSQVGACIVSQDGKVVGIGHNCMPNGCGDKLIPWERRAQEGFYTKYPYVCHAVLNAIMNKFSADVRGCTIYVAVFPCNECAKVMIQAGLKKVVYYSDKYSGHDSLIASKELLRLAGVESELFKSKSNKTGIVIDFESINRIPAS